MGLKRWLKNTFLTFFIGGPCVGFAFEFTSFNVEKDPDTNVFTISYEVTGDDSTDLFIPSLMVRYYDGYRFSPNGYTEIPVKFTSSDAFHARTPGVYSFQWNINSDWPNNYSEKIQFVLRATKENKRSGGVKMWGVIDAAEVPFTMGIVARDNEGVAANLKDNNKDVTITHELCLARYEIMQDQYAAFLTEALRSGRVAWNGSGPVTSTMTTSIDSSIPVGVTLCNVSGEAKGLTWDNATQSFVCTDKSYTTNPMLVTWWGALAYCQYYGYDLPTSAEWEYIAREENKYTGSHNLYPWGNDFAEGHKRSYFYDPNYSITGKPSPNWTIFYANVTTLREFVAGLIGNAPEWTRSIYRSNFVQNYPDVDATHAAVNAYASIDYRIVRGTGTMHIGYLTYASPSELRGFRPVDRVASTKGLELLWTETFDTFPQGATTVTTDTGTWHINGAVSTTTDGFAGTTGIKGATNNSVNSHVLTLPPLSGRIAKIRCKVKALPSSTTGYPTIGIPSALPTFYHLQCASSTKANFTSPVLSISEKQTVFKTLDIPVDATLNNDSLTLAFSPNLIIDNLQVFTVVDTPLDPDSSLSGNIGSGITVTPETIEIASDVYFEVDTGGRYIDTDGDGMPDYWELRHSRIANNDNIDHTTYLSPTNDADKDGLSNLEEYIYGTNPYEANEDPLQFTYEVVPSEEASNNGFYVNLGWNTLPGRTYSLFYTDDLSNWKNDPIEHEGTGERKTVSLNLEGEHYFFKLRVSRPPLPRTL